MSTSGPFYDSAAANSLADYVYGNPRLEAAIGHALRWIPPEARSIIDVGCGIGWSTWEIKRNFAGASVLGIDLSAARLKLASTLFSAPGLTFAVASVLEMPVPEASADVAVMLDVYEHVQNRAVPHSTKPSNMSSLFTDWSSCPALLRIIRTTSGTITLSGFNPSMKMCRATISTLQPEVSGANSLFPRARHLAAERLFSRGNQPRTVQERSTEAGSSAGAVRIRTSPVQPGAETDTFARLARRDSATAESGLVRMRGAAEPAGIFGNIYSRSHRKTPGHSPHALRRLVPNPERR